MSYNKPAFTIEQHISQLRQRGLIINDELLATHFISFVSYYRLAGYWWSMQSDKVNHTFKPNSTFENVIQLYNFDRELRILLFDVIERIEIALRTKLINHLSTELGPNWFEDPANFKNEDHHKFSLKLIDGELSRSKEVFIVEHKNKHPNDPNRPPAWKTLEIISFGTLSKLYGNLKPTVKSKKRIAKDLNAVNHEYLQSWLQSIAQIRNLCAHHCRLWNKNLPGRLKVLPNPPAKWIDDVPIINEPSINEHKQLYIHLCIMKYLINVISPGHTFGVKLKMLMTKYPNIDPYALGMKPNWHEEPLWQEDQDKKGCLTFGIFNL
mgnify:CR=1 FL=1|jgi:abortive infection bacteriophage resistance protein